MLFGLATIPQLEAMPHPYEYDTSLIFSGSSFGFGSSIRVDSFALIIMALADSLLELGILKICFYPLALALAGCLARHPFVVVFGIVYLPRFCKLSPQSFNTLRSRMHCILRGR